MNRARNAEWPQDTGGPGLAAPAAPGAVIMGPREWALMPHRGAPPGQDMRDALRALAAREPPPGCALVPVSAAALPQAAPGALLHCRRGRAVIYCDRGEVCETAAAGIGLVVGRILTGLAAPGAAEGPLSASVDLAEHEALPRMLHPAACCMRSADITLTVCRNLMSPRLAALLAEICTAHLRITPPQWPGSPHRGRRHLAATAPPGRRDSR
jgi:hypothetical protein